MKRLFLLTLLLFSSLSAAPAYSPRKIRNLYNSLDPTSISEHLAFYELYPHTIEGEFSLQHAWQLLSQKPYRTPSTHLPPTKNLFSSLQAIIGLINRWDTSALTSLPEADLDLIEHLASALPNRSLQGQKATEETAVIALPPEQIDIARALLLSQFSTKEDPLPLIRTYEAMIDLMALQILARLSPDASPPDKIRTINHFLFEEMGFAFPPHSLYAKDIDLYTFLPSVLDCRKGVCLGVSILYLALAQRLALPLEIITPPGHIYIRYQDKNQLINIETTARGVHIDSEEYLGIDTCALQERTLKEVVGMAHINQASIFWSEDKQKEALDCYQKALPYLPDDPLLKELMAYNYLFIGEKKKGETLLKQVENYCPPHAIAKETIAEDYLQGKIDAAGIQAIFHSVDENRSSILEKKEAIQEILTTYPTFRAGLFHLAVTHLQLHQVKDALLTLQRYHALDPTNPTVEYYLTILSAERFHYNNSWEHLHQTEALLKPKNHAPKALLNLRRQLALLTPE